MSVTHCTGKSTGWDYLNKEDEFAFGAPFSNEIQEKCAIDMVSTESLHGTALSLLGTINPFMEGKGKPRLIGVGENPFRRLGRGARDD